MNCSKRGIVEEYVIATGYSGHMNAASSSVDSAEPSADRSADLSEMVVSGEEDITSDRTGRCTRDSGRWWSVDRANCIHKEGGCPHRHFLNEKQELVSRTTYKRRKQFCTSQGAT